MDTSDVALYVGACLMAFATGFAAGLLHRYWQKIAESLSSLG